MNVKGISITVNALIILVLAIFVLMAMIALFSGVWPGTSKNIDCQAQLRNFCLTFNTRGCCPDPTDDCRKFAYDNINEECRNKYGMGTSRVNIPGLGLVWVITNIENYCCT
ncbi:MAG: hypothetical protein DRP11_00630 [Candidatus Aenigmatarchaeota archaeon]|nr:MAG: hypothetical protein DRP11_00630 [Candidatus Aenigmarchaeota archaeon]